MTRRQTYRVLVRKAAIHSIDIAARSEEVALTRAERLWHGGVHGRFEHIEDDEPEFEIDDAATGHLADIVNDDRASSALKALCAFAAETGSELGREALHDLLCDLGHHADRHGLDFTEEVQRATTVWVEEKTAEVAS